MDDNDVGELTVAPVRRGRSPLTATRSGSASALLLVVLGEFVWPSPDPVWSNTLLTILDDLDVERTAGRKAIQRAAASGVVRPEREGRRVKWMITDAGFRLLAAGDKRVLRWDSRNRDWDGRWLVVSVNVPQNQRKLRHHVHAQLSWAGLGSAVAGEWITPHWERADDVAAILSDLGLADQTHMFIGEAGPLTDMDGIVPAAWNLDELAADYREFIDDWSTAVPATDADCLRSRVLITQDWRRFPYLDPDLPSAYLPTGWPGERAAESFRRRRNDWAVQSLRYWNKVVADTSETP